MRSKILLLAGAVLTATLASSHAGGAVGVRWGGGGGGAVGVRWGGGGAVGVGWGGGRYCYGGPRWYGGAWRGPAVRVVAPAPVVVAPVYAPARTVVVAPGAGASVVVAAQQRLANLGYYPGPIDGAFGPMTSSAVATYQQDQGLPVTGRLDRRTRASLGI